MRGRPGVDHFPSVTFHLHITHLSFGPKIFFFKEINS